MRYPDVIQFDKFSEVEKKQIFADIECRMAPSYVPSAIYTDYCKERWEYNGSTWTGPNGMTEAGIIGFLPERYPEKK